MKRFRRLAAQAIGACAAYATVEIWFHEILRFVRTRDEFAPTTPLFATVLLLGYLALALVLAAALTALRNSDDESELLATGALLAVFITNLLFNLHQSVVPLLLIAIALMACVALRVRLLATSWAVALVLVGPEWVANTLLERQSLFVRSAAYGGAVVAAVAACWLVSRMRTRLWLRAGVVITSIALAYGLRQPARADLGDPRETPSSGAPNVLLITLDTVRADHLSLYGYTRTTTPELQRIGKAATVYQRAIAPSNMTLSTHASLFTGLFPSQHGARFIDANGAGAPLRDDVPTLAERFRRRGYDVSSVAANTIYLGTSFGLDRGFTHLFNEIPRRPNASLDLLTSRKTHLLRYGIWRVARRLWRGFDIVESCTPADSITRVALERIDHAGRIGRPFFLFVNYFDAHEPYQAPAAYRARFRAPDDSERERTIARYDAAIAFIDGEVGRLLREMDRRRVLEGTLIVITSDHGEAFGEHATWGHGSSVYDEQVRVPLLIRVPGAAPAVVSNAVSLIDVFSLLVNGTPIGAAPVLAEAFPLAGVARGTRTVHAGRAFIEGDCKLIRSAFGGGEELYDIRVDLAEVRNIAQERIAVRTRMSAALNEWIAAHPVHAAGRLASPLRRETIERLRSLGYMQ